MKSRLFSTLAIIFALTALARSSAQAQTLTIDDFDHSNYTNGEEIATSASSMPWLRSGNVEDGLYVTKSASQDGAGTFGAQIPVDPTAGTGFAIVARNYGVATNFSAYNQASVFSESLTAGTAASLKLYLSDGTTTYVTATAQPESNTSTPYVFSLTATAFGSPTVGSEPFSTVLGASTRIGFEITSSTGAVETIAFDDFAVESTPEPCTGGLMLAGFGAMALRRPRHSLGSTSRSTM